MVVRRFLSLVSLLLFAGSAAAAVTAGVDRGNVELNESLTLRIVTDIETDEAPDVSVLDADFYVGRARTESRSVIANNQFRSTFSWSYVLMPKRTGRLTIPPIALGNERTEQLTVVVTEPTYAPPGEADVFVTSDVDLEESYVQAQTLLTVKIYRAVPTRQPTLREPSLSGVEYLMERVGDDRLYQAVIDGTAYEVIERVYAVYPQESGTLEISPAQFEARVLRDGRITGRKVFRSEAHTIEVLPIPPLPADRPDAPWLPARDVRVVEQWSGDPGEIQAGEPLTRHVTVSVLGQLETQIPVLDPPDTAGVNVYPDKPELDRRVEAGGILGVRSDQYAIIGTQAGSYTLPAVELPWWNIETREWQVATLPERTVTVRSSAPPAPPPVEVEASVPAVAPATDAVPPAGLPAGSGPWRHASELLAVLWVLTLLGWWWTSRPRDTVRAPAPVPPHRQQARHLKAARRAALAGDGSGVRQAMLAWAALQWPHDAPRSIGELAERVSAPLSVELGSLSRAAYGPGAGQWNGEALAKALRSFAVLGDDRDAAGETLPPLMPG